MSSSRTLQALAILAAVAFAAVAFLPHLTDQAQATHQPADKMAVAGSALEIISTPLLDGARVSTEEILWGQLKTSGPTDLVLSLSMECALWTDVTTIGNDDSESMARVKAWIEIDGVPVRVSSDDTNEPGKVVFCDRTYRRATTDFDDEDARIDTYLRTRSAHDFQWISLNLGPGVHTISVKAELETTVTGTGMAQAAIGKRTLVVEPTKLANDVHI